MRQLKITKSITNRESQSLEKYLQEIGKVELITSEEEVAFGGVDYLVDLAISLRVEGGRALPGRCRPALPRSLAVWINNPLRVLERMAWPEKRLPYC